MHAFVPERSNDIRLVAVLAQASSETYRLQVASERQMASLFSRRSSLVAHLHQVAQQYGPKGPMADAVLAAAN